MTRATPSTSSIPESQSSDKPEGKHQANEKESGTGPKSWEGGTGGDESTLVLGEGPTVASSAYLRRPTAGMEDDKGSNAPKPLQEVEDEVSLICL